MTTFIEALRRMEDPPVIWVVGRVTDEAAGAWEFQGGYATEEEAISRCEDATWFIGPIQIGVFIPTQRLPGWPGGYRPVKG